MAEKTHVKRLRKALESFEEAPDVVSALAAARRVREAAEVLEQANVNDARRAGVTWEEIGWIYDMSRQGAHQRFKGIGAKPGKGAGRSGTLPA